MNVVNGQQLPVGEAKKLFERFEAFRSSLPEAAQQLLPNAVCYNLNSLQQYLGRVKEMLTEKGIPEDQQSIAMFFGKHNDAVKESHLRDKCTTVLVAAASTSNDEGRITAIDCCVLKQGEFPAPGESPDDLSFDLGSLNP